MKDPKHAEAIREYQRYRREARKQNKRQRSFKAQETAHFAGNMKPRAGQSGIGGELRLDVASRLTKNEADIFSLMLDAMEMSTSKTVVRVAGGWVRDKLLGLEVTK